MKKRLRAIRITTLVLLTFALDQISKNIVRNNISESEIINVLGNYLTLKRIENPGAVLGIGANLPSMSKTIYFQLLPIFVLLYFFRLILVKVEISKLTVFGLAMAIGGAVGNIYDRAIYGSVTDFIQLKMGMLKTGIFNIADIFVVTGTIIVILELIFNKDNNLEASL